MMTTSGDRSEDFHENDIPDIPLYADSGVAFSDEDEWTWRGPGLAMGLAEADITY